MRTPSTTPAGCSGDEDVQNFKQALKLNPDSAIACIEYATGLVVTRGKIKRRLDRQLAKAERGLTARRAAVREAASTVCVDNSYTWRPEFV